MTPHPPLQKNIYFEKADLSQAMIVKTSFKNIDLIPSIFKEIITSAFKLKSIYGGFLFSKAIGLAAAGVSMLTLESTMLTTFGGEDMAEETRRLFLALSGAAVVIFIVSMAVYMIAQGNKKLKQRIAKLISYSEEVHKWLDETYREKEDVVRTELQKRVNDNFSKMYHGSRTITMDNNYKITIDFQLNTEVLRHNGTYCGY